LRRPEGTAASRALMALSGQPVPSLDLTFLVPGRS